MNVYDFHSWLHQRDRRQREHVPAADLVVPLVAQAGRHGLSRGEIGTAIGGSLSRDALDDLLAGLVEFGLLSVERQNGVQVFRSLGRINFTTQV
jgi:hypothetical protein